MGEVIEHVSAGQAVAMTPMTIIQLALDKNLDLERIEKLLAISEQWRKLQAEQAFNRALAQFKESAPVVMKNAVNSQYDSDYATIGHLVNTINPALAKCGLSASWDIDQTNGIKVTCILENVEGHKRMVSMIGPPDKSGAKNALQEIRSTITYLRVVTFESVTGIISADRDDDGNSAGKSDDAPEKINEEQIANIKALLTEVGADQVRFLQYLKVGAISDIYARSYSAVIKLIEAKRGR